MPQRITHCLIIIFLFHFGTAQVRDDFEDGDFANGPVWTGNEEYFQITNGQLNNNGPSSSSELFLSTPNSLLSGTIWEFFIEIQGTAPSGSNKVRMYLISDIPDLTGEVNGYYLEIGQSNDDYLNLKRGDNGSGTTILSGTGVFDTRVRVRIHRSEAGVWTLLADHSGGFDFQEEGSVADDTFSSTSFFGVVVNHTSNRNQDFYFDDFVIEQLQIEALTVTNNLTMEVNFNQPVGKGDAEDIDNYSIPGVALSSAVQTAPDKVRITLDSNTPLTSGDFSLTALSGLTKNAPASFDFEYLDLGIESILTLSETIIQLDFNDDLNVLSAEDESSYLIDSGIGQPTSANVDVLDQSIVTLTLDNSLFEGETFQLSISNIVNSSGNSALSATEDFTFVIPLVVDTTYAYSESSLLVTFNNELNETLAQDPSNYAVDNGIGSPSEAILQEDGKSIKLDFSGYFNNAEYTLTINNLEDLSGTKISPGSTAAFDYLHLELVSLEQLDERSIRVNFNQTVDNSTSSDLLNYSLSEKGNPVSAVIAEDGTSVILEFDQLFNTTYSLDIRNVINFYQNSTIDDLTGEINIEVPTLLRSILINELLPDPTPTVGLPEAEYIELLNVTGQSINLEGFLLNDEPLPDYVLDAGSLVVIADDGDASLFTAPNSLFVSSFDVLTNSGEAVVLKDQFGNTVDSISYDLSWYKDTEKDDGGFSLELMDPFQPCSDKSNWTASNNASGGTPGDPNSVFSDAADMAAPLLEKVVVAGEDTLYLLFSEPIDPASLLVTSFVLPGYTISSLESTGYSEYYLKSDGDLKSEMMHMLSVSDISDCRGNTLSQQDFLFYHDTKPPQLERIILLSPNEIALVFHEPLDKSAAENENNFSIAGSKPAKALLQDSTSHRVHLAFDTQFNDGSPYSLHFSGLADTLKNETNVTVSTFEYFRGIDTAYVVAANLLEVQFSEAPLKSTATNPSQYFVTEGVGRPTDVVADADNQKLFRLAFETNFDENKELKIYAEGLSRLGGQFFPTPAYPFTYDTRAPMIEYLEVKNDSQLVVSFNEKVDLSIATATNLYELENGINPKEVLQLTDKRLVLTFAEKFAVEMEKTLSVRGISDFVGNAMKSTRHLSFTYDPKPPEVVAVKHLNDTSLQVTLSEIPELSSLVHANFTVGELNPCATRILGPDSLNVILYFPFIPSEADNQIITKGLEDKRGNVSAASTFFFNSLNPQISGFYALNDTLLRVDFSKPMSRQALSTAYYQVKDFSVESVEAINDFSYRLLVNRSFSEGDSLLLAVNEMTDLNGMPLQDHEVLSIFESYLTSLEVLDAKTIRMFFSTTFSAVSKSWFHIDGNGIALATMDGADRSQIVLSLEKPLPENKPYKLLWQGITDAYDRNLPGYFSLVSFDTQAPEITQLASDLFGALNLTFSEPLNDEISSSADRYHIVGLGNPEEVEPLSDSVLMLRYGERLSISGRYVLISEGVMDLSGNSSQPDTLLFTYEPPEVPSYLEIVITEIMADPTPSVGLPEEEYVEIHNLSDKPFNLKGMMFGDATKTLPLPDYELGPEEYVLISSAASLFEVPNRVQVHSLPALGNSGDSIFIQNVYGELVDEVTYQTSWYGGGDKADGGYSLEIINPHGACPGSVNWKASESDLGGTPGVQNSIFNTGLDKTQPEIVSAEVLDATTLKISFNEAMDSLSMANVTIVGMTVSSKLVGGGYNEVLYLEIQTIIEKGDIYQLEVSGAMDCTGNTMKPTSLAVGIGKKPGFNELIITEIMADPEPSAGLPVSEYLEIYNATEKLLFLEGLRLSDGNDTTTLPSVILGAQQYLLLLPSSSVPAFENPNKVGISRWISLANAGEDLFIVHGEDVIFQVTYSAGWHDSEEKSEGGYSLEMKDVFNPCGGDLNWGSSVSTAGGTPGLANSNADNVPDNFGPNLISVVAVSADSLKLLFDEALHPDAPRLASFSISPESDIDSIYKEPFRRNELYLKLKADLTVNLQYSLEVNAIIDCNGNPVRKNSGSFVLPDEPDSLDLIINEILFDPRSDGVDFVEIYNNSSKYLDLKNWQIARDNNGELDGRTITEHTMVMAPETYLAITRDTLILKSHYPAFSQRLFQISGLPTFPNDEGTAVLISPTGVVSDRFTYEDDFHQPFLKSVDGVSLERIDFNAPTQDPNNWQSASATAGFATPGYINSQSFEAPVINGSLQIVPKVFVPNSTNPAHQSFTTINYHLDKGGQFANIQVYNQLGQPVAELAKGSSLSTSGFIRWDGTDSAGRIVRMGYYVVFFELYDSDGNQQVLKETVVVGSSQ